MCAPKIFMKLRRDALIHAHKLYYKIIIWCSLAGVYEYYSSCVIRRDLLVGCEVHFHGRNNFLERTRTWFLYVIASHLARKWSENLYQGRAWIGSWISVKIFWFAIHRGINFPFFNWSIRVVFIDLCGSKSKKKKSTFFLFTFGKVLRCLNE